MRSKLGQEVRRLFRQFFKSELPRFVEDKTQTVPSGTVVWREDSGKLSFFIVLFFSPTYDWFLLEGGWSKRGTLESNEGLYWERSRIVQEPSIFRIETLLKQEEPYLWWCVLNSEAAAKYDFDYEDDPIEQVLPLVPGKVEKATGMIKELIMPVFEEIAARELGKGSLSEAAKTSQGGVLEKQPL